MCTWYNCISVYKGEYMDLFETLRNDILKGKVKRGEKLTEQKVCETYNVSRTPVREAFQRLEMDGLIDIIPNKGAYVYGMSKQDIEDMYTLRKAYEQIAVTWAIDRISSEELDKLKEAYDLMEFYTMKEDPDKMLQMNTKFHQIIYTATGNRMLQNVLTSFQVYTKNTKLSNEYITSYFTEVLSEHKAIFDAIIAKDKVAACEAIEVHMDNSKRRAGFGK